MPHYEVFLVIVVALYMMHTPLAGILEDLIRMGYDVHRAWKARR
jgi:hypothetical protein